MLCPAGVQEYKLQFASSLTEQDPTKVRTLNTPWAVNGCMLLWPDFQKVLLVAMCSHAVASLILCGLLVLSQTSAYGFETDQYNLPPRPLADIGDEVTEHVEQKMRQAIEQINA